ncbi:MAG TPA: chromate transporter [Vicinamibacterales bacterium]|nr:chromate transporter [Vicinamibacterales bacterium]
MNDESTATRLAKIFVAFLVIGATSFGGGVVAHLRTSIVVKRRWMDDKTFIELLTISQTLPGLKAANLAMLIGDRLSGAAGAIAAIAGICLPGALLMYLVGVMYQVERQRPLVEAALTGVAPAAVGLILATTAKLGRASLSCVADLMFVALTVVCVNRLHVPVPLALIGVAVLAILWHAFTGSPKEQSV